MVKVNKSKCIGCGACAALCPKGMIMKNGKAEIKDAKAPCIKNAAESCPVNAIEM